MIPLSPHDLSRGQYALRLSDSEDPLYIGSCVLPFPVLPCHTVNTAVAFGDVLTLASPTDPERQDFRVLGIIVKPGGWLIVKGHIIYPAGHRPMIGKPEIRVIHRRHIVGIVKDH